MPKPLTSEVGGFHMVLVDIAAALICFNSVCHAALLGRDTPRGTYRLEQTSTYVASRDIGDVLKFAETSRDLFAVHRTWPGREGKYAWSPDRRRQVTLGCINVTPQVYRELVECCNGTIIRIK